jgi:hypothetical protein
VPPFAGYRELLRNRRFVLFEASATAASVGYSVYAISIPWLTFRFTGSLLLVGLVLFAEYGVYSLTFLVAPWVDRARNKRTIFLACYPVQAVAAALIGAALADRFLTSVLLLGLVAFISFLWDFPWAAYNIVPRLLLSSDQLFRAEGFAGLLGGATQIGGYTAGAILVVFVGPSGGMFLYAVLLGVGTVLAALVSLPSPASGIPSRYWAEFRDGWKHFSRKAERSLLQLGSAELVRGFFAVAPALLITLVAARVLSGNGSAYSALFASWVIGGVVVGLILGELNPRRQVGWILLGTSLTEGTFVLFAVLLAPYPLPSALLWFLIGASGTAYLSSLYAFLRGAFPADSIGRITANLYVFTGLSSSAGAVVLGAVANTWPPLAFGTLVGAGLLVVGALIFGLPSIRRLAF